MLRAGFLTFLQILLLSQNTQAFLGNLFRSGQGCSCPCRTITVRRCLDSYGLTPHHHQVTARNVTETECQVCRHIQDTEMVDSFKW